MRRRSYPVKSSKSFLAILMLLMLLMLCSSVIGAGGYLLLPKTPKTPGPTTPGPTTPGTVPVRSITSTVSPTGQGIDVSQFIAPPSTIVYDENAYKVNYGQEGIGAYYGGNNLFHETSLSGDWVERETHCFNKCTNLPNCVIMTLGKGTDNSTTQCWGKGSDGYNVRTTSPSHISYHKN